MHPAEVNEAFYVQKLYHEHEDVEGKVHCELSWSREFSPGERRRIQCSIRQGNLLAISDWGEDITRRGPRFLVAKIQKILDAC